ncbi:phytoene desaturase family protein [Nitriliruptor alkaliphilus]|uniref:phytoene desaturase family protein n=1 Tax=Nitriliruptor alkaliphilus TaxID=427918 RepID=UPI0006990C75|nr:NAD(P)/FAD-dependent oxidoreductase [Nitriliruptor alkaliphilus]
MSRGERADAVVIGAGQNGLAAAIRLARAGRDVVVLEAQPQAGGAVISQPLTLPGFLHDTFSAVHPAAAASPVFARMPLDQHGLDWVHPEVAMAHPMPDGRAGVLYRDLDRTAAHLNDLHPGDGTAWADWARPYLDRWPAMRSTMLGGFPPLAGAVKLVAALKLEGTLEFARLLLTSAEQLSHDLFASEHARAWLYGSVLHGDVGVQEPGSAIAGAYLQLLGHAAGWPSPRGGAGRLSDALVSYLATLGGEVRTSTRVERIVTAGGRVAGVVTADGGRIRAPVVIADTTPHAMLDLVGGAMPAHYAGRLRRFRYGPGTVKIDWALDGPVPWTVPEARAAGTVHVGGEGHVVAQQAADIRAGRPPEHPFLLFGQQTVADPSRAPAGKHTAWAYTRVPGTLTGQDAVLAHVERMTDQVERFAPGFRDLVLASHVQGPADLQAGDVNLVGGDVGGGTYRLDQVVFRPLPSLVPYATPIGGLWLGSSSTFPGGAVHGVPGWTAASYALARSRFTL